MKFCMVTTFYPPYHFGGDGTYVRALSEGLARRGHEVTVVHCEDAFRLNSHAKVVAVPETSAVQVHRLRSRRGWLSPLITQQLGVPGLKSAQLREILADDFDVVNFHNISLVGGPGVLALSRAPVTLYTLHEHWLLCATHIFWKNKRKACDSRQCIRCSVISGIPPQWWRYTPLLESSLRHVDRFISPSHYTADRHRELLDIRVPIDVVPLFSRLDPGGLLPPRCEAQPEQPEFLYVGRITPSKGVAELLASFDKWPQFKLTVIGNGEILEALQQRYRDSANIHFTGPLPQDELIAYYRQAQALILPSLAPETFGLTVVEAFSCGTPAIVRAAGGNRETIDVSAAGYVYHDERGLREALEAFVGDPQLRENLGIKARAAYEAHYTENQHLQRYLQLVEETMQEKTESHRNDTHGGNNIDQ